MCGIAGIAVPRSWSGRIEAAELHRLTRTLRHRGPDDEGYFCDDAVGLGSRRLSIIDLSPSGRMPVENEDGTIVVVQNGEIYNFRELKGELTTRGHKFRGHSDSEVYAHLFEEKGTACFSLLDGMFAVALYDRRNRKLVLARDRFGEKPLYYSILPGNRLLFASELRVFLTSDHVPRDLDMNALDSYLQLGFFVAPTTPLRAVRKLPPGSFAVLNLETGAWQTEQYWRFPMPDPISRIDDESSAIEEFDRIFSKTVRSRLQSDVPLGVLLSSGVDSSLVAAMMTQSSSKPVQTICVGSEDSAATDETRTAKEIARILGTNHETILLGRTDYLPSIEVLPELLDEPHADPAILSVHLISKSVRAQGLKVMLCGDGGDEFFMGYDSFTWLRYVTHIHHLPLSARRITGKMLHQIGSALNRSRLQRIGDLVKQESIGWATRVALGYGAWTREDTATLLAGNQEQDLGSTFANVDIDMLGGGDIRYAWQRVLIEKYLADNNCSRMDRPSMWHSVEVRSPFLSPELADFTQSLAIALKVRNGTRKFIVKRALEKYLPKNLIYRPKSGFNALPVAHLLRTDWNHLLSEYLSRERLVTQGLMSANSVEAVVHAHVKRGMNNGVRLWSLIVLQMWLKRWMGH